MPKALQFYYHYDDNEGSVIQYFTIIVPMSMVKSFCTKEHMKYTQANLEDFKLKW